MNDTVDGWNPAPPGMYKHCKYWDELPTSTGAGFLPSTVGNPDLFFFIWYSNLSGQLQAPFLKRQAAAFVLAFLRLAGLADGFSLPKGDGLACPTSTGPWFNESLWMFQKNGATTFTSFQYQLRFFGSAPAQPPLPIIHVIFFMFFLNVLTAISGPQNLVLLCEKMPTVVLHDGKTPWSFTVDVQESLQQNPGPHEPEIHYIDIYLDWKKVSITWFLSRLVCPPKTASWYIISCNSYCWTEANTW